MKIINNLSMGKFALFVLMILPGISQAEYDYHHASECDAKHFDSQFGYAIHVEPKFIDYVICPIPRIYPRSSSKLRRVTLYMRPYDARTAAYASVCTKLSENENRSNCVTKLVIGNYFQTVVFDENDLQSIRNVPYGWAQFLYISVQQYTFDKLYGYRIDWSL